MRTERRRYINEIIHRSLNFYLPDRSKKNRKIGKTNFINNNKYFKDKGLYRTRKVSHIKPLCKKNKKRGTR